MNIEQGILNIEPLFIVRYSVFICSTIMKALLLIDIQNDFCVHGALEVNDADAIVPIANRLMPLFDVVVATQDWHPADHKSFAANHLWRKVGQVIDLNGLTQTLHPMHCVQNMMGANFHRGLNTDGVHHVVRKGTDAEIDGRSGFFDNGKRTETDLDVFLKSLGVKEVYIMGLATDYCVKFTALDAVDLGYKTYLIEDACRGFDLNAGDNERAIADMAKFGVYIIHSNRF
jgi:nicotinamidase/pyrazinamidase